MPGRKATTIEQQSTNEQEATNKKSRRANGEGSPRTRSDGRIEVRVSLPDGTRKSVYGKNRKEALARAKALKQQVEQGTYVPPSQETVADHLRHWLSMNRLKWSDGTYMNYRNHVENHLIPALGKIPIQKLTASHVQSLCTDLHLHKHLEASMTRKIFETLRMALKQAIKERKIAINPTSDVILPKVEKKEMRYLTSDEIERIIQAARHHRHGCLYLVAVVTGLRRNELLALKWEDVDLERSTIQVKRSLSYRSVDHQGCIYKEKGPKTASSRRSILLPPFAVEALRQHHSRQIEERSSSEEWHDLGLVFPNRNGLHQSPSGMYTTYKRFLRRAGIADATFHATRHGHATSLLEMGENPRVVQERLGHSNITITLGIYGHVTPTMQQQATTKLHARFGAQYEATGGQ